MIVGWAWNGCLATQTLDRLVFRVRYSPGSDLRSPQRARRSIGLTYALIQLLKERKREREGVEKKRSKEREWFTVRVTPPPTFLFIYCANNFHFMPYLKRRLRLRLWLGDSAALKNISLRRARLGPRDGTAGEWKQRKPRVTMTTWSMDLCGRWMTRMERLPWLHNEWAVRVETRRK